MNRQPKPDHGSFDPPVVSFRADEFAGRVLELIDIIPAGRVLSYGDIADFLGAGGPRQVAKVLARNADGAPWHRVICADGTAANAIATEQITRLRAEGAAFIAGSARVDMRRARWQPDPDASAADQISPSGQPGRNH